MNQHATITNLHTHQHLSSTYHLLHPPTTNSYTNAHPQPASTPTPHPLYRQLSTPHNYPQPTTNSLPLTSHNQPATPTYYHQHQTTNIPTASYRQSSSHPAYISPRAIHLPNVEPASILSNHQHPGTNQHQAAAQADLTTRNTKTPNPITTSHPATLTAFIRSSYFSLPQSARTNICQTAATTTQGLNTSNQDFGPMDSQVHSSSTARVNEPPLRLPSVTLTISPRCPISTQPRATCNPHPNQPTVTDPIRPLIR